MKIYLFFLKMNFKGWKHQKNFFLSLVIFSLCLILLFPFSFGHSLSLNPLFSLGIFWIINEFISVLMFQNTFSHEIENQFLDVIMTSQNSLKPYYYAKVSAHVLQMILIQVVFILFWVLFLQVRWSLVNPYSFFLALFVFNVGTGALGVLIDLAYLKGQHRHIATSCLFYPLQISLLLGCVAVTSPEFLRNLSVVFDARTWWTLIVSYGIVFLTLGGILIDQL